MELFSIRIQRTFQLVSTLTTAAGQLFALLLVVALFYFVARLVFALAWRLFVGFVFVLIIILLIL